MWTPRVALALILSASWPAPAAAGDAGIAASGDEAVRWGARIDGLARDGTLRAPRAQADADFPDRRTLRYDQQAGGVRVLGGQLVRQVDGLGRTVAVFGRLPDVTGAPTVPVLTAGEASRAAEQQVGGQALGTPELVILPGAAPALTWMLWTRDGTALQRVLIDARTGGVALSWNDLQTVAAVGIGSGVWNDRKKVSTASSGAGFRARDELRPAPILTYDVGFHTSVSNNFLRTRQIEDSWLASDDDNDWSDGTVVDAHTYAGWTYDYYFKRHGRHGLDDADMPIRSLTHFASQAQAYLNAFWDPFSQSMSYGDGDGTRYQQFSGALDVVAHELTHGVTQFTWQGMGHGESGALNEAFSDIMGTSVEFFQQPAGNGRLQADYWIGEDLAVNFDPARTAIRSMDNPGIFCFPDYGCDPDHYSKRYLGPRDSAGVHVNCAIPNQAFYLLIEGGTNRTSGIHVDGLGGAHRDRAEKIFYRGFTQLLTSAATFSDARRATVEAARQLYGPTSTEAAQTAAAWTAVGVD